MTAFPNFSPIACRAAISAAAAALPLCAPVAVRAAPVTPSAYSMPNGESGSFHYWDDTFSGSGNHSVDGASLTNGLGQLTDGVLGGANWQDDLGNGSSYEWVGWVSIQPIITFQFAGPLTFTSLGFHSNNNQQGGVGLYGSVLLEFSTDGVNFANPITYTTSAVDRADTTSRFIDINTPRTASFIRATFQDGDQSWIFLSEARFNATAIAVPEPGTLTLAVPVGAGALLALRAARRRRRR